MATGGPVKLTCPICLNYFEDRVTIVECSHSFCGACLTRRWKELEESCPLCKETIQTRDKYLKMVTEKRERHLAHKKAIEKDSQDLLEETISETQRTVVKFRELRQFLEEQEKFLLGQMALLEKEIAREREEHLDRVSSELSCLESLIRNMEQQQQQPTIEFLQDVKRTLKRYEEKQTFGDLVAFPAQLKWKVCDVHVINDFLEVHMKQFKAKINVTLDPDPAHPQVVLSEIQKSVKLGEKSQELPNNPERFDSRPFVMECEEHPHHPRAVPGASSSSFSSHQTILDAAPMAVPSGSVSGFTEGVSTESAAAQSAALSMSVSLEEVYKGPKKAWSPKRILERATAQTEAEESDHQEDAFSGASAQESEPESSVSAFPESPEPPHLTPATAVEEEAPLGAKQLSGSDNRLSLQEPTMATSPSHPGAVPGASSSSFSSHQIILDSTQTAVPSNSVSVFTGGASTEPAAPSESRTESRSASSMLGSLEEVYKGPAKASSQERIRESETVPTKAVESDQQEDAFSGAPAQESEPEPQPSGSTFPGSPELPQPTPRTARAKEGLLGAKQLPRKVSARKKSRRTALTGITTSARIPGFLPSSPPTKGRRTSIVWKYFTQLSKYKAKCGNCLEVVKIGNEGCNLGTSSLLQHLKRKHPCCLEQDHLHCRMSKQHFEFESSHIHWRRQRGAERVGHTRPPLSREPHPTWGWAHLPTRSSSRCFVALERVSEVAQPRSHGFRAPKMAAAAVPDAILGGPWQRRGSTTPGP